MDFLNSPQALKVEDEEDKGLSRCRSGLLQQQLAFWIRAADLSLFTYSPLEQEVDAHLNPTQHTVGHGAQQHTGQLTCFDLPSALGPWDMPPISSGTTQKLSVSTAWASAHQPVSVVLLKHTHTHLGIYTIYSTHYKMTHSNIIQVSHTAPCKHNLSHTSM